MTKQKHSFPHLRDRKPPERHFNLYVIPLEETIVYPMVVQPEEKPEPSPLPKPKKPTVKLDTTAVVVNYKTKHLIKKAVQSFRRYYPSVPLILIDNNSQDGSSEWCNKQAGEHTTVIICTSNIGHGPALDLGIKQAKTRYVFTFDSDVVFNRGGFLEKMQSVAGRENYAVGWLRWVNRNGVSSRNKNATWLCPYIHPHAALYDRDIYLTLKPFNHKGAPCADNMHDAKSKGIRVAGFPVENFVTHLVAGTRRMYKGHWDGNGKTPERWNPDARIPI